MTLRTIGLDGKRVPVSSLEELDERDRAALERLLSDPNELDRRCREALLDPALTEGQESTGLYVSHHLEQLPDLRGAPRGSTATVIDAFVKKMAVRSIWASGDATTAFLHVDYTIDAARTD